MIQIAPETILKEINDKNDTRWTVDSKLAGGILGGAWKITDGNQQAVLKLHDSASSVPHNPDASKIVAYIRENGYPTPKWFAAGILESGVTYSIQEFLIGTRLQHLDQTAASIIIDLVRLQRTLRPPTDLNWTSYMIDHVFQPHPSHNLLKIAGGTASRVLNEAMAIAAPYKGLDLEENEMVHCDLSVSNILVENDKLVGVVDIDAAGRGCAVYDVLSGALNGVIWDARPEAISLLHSFALETYGAGPVAIAAGTLSVEGLAWSLESSPESVEMAAQKSLAWLSQIRALIV